MPNLLRRPAIAEIDLPLPQAEQGPVEHSSGRLVIQAPESLQVNPPKFDGLRPVSIQEALAGISLSPSVNGRFHASPGVGLHLRPGAGRAPPGG